MTFEAFKKMYKTYFDYQTKAGQEVALHNNLSFVDTIRKNYQAIDTSNFSEQGKKTLQRAIDIGCTLDPTTLNIDLDLGAGPDVSDRTNFSDGLFLTRIYYNTDFWEKIRDHGLIDLACGTRSYPQLYHEYFSDGKTFADYKPKFWIGVDKYAQQTDDMSIGFRFIQDDMIETLRTPGFPQSNIMINGFDLYVSRPKKDYTPNVYMALLMLEMHRIVPSGCYVFCCGSDLYSDIWHHKNVLTLEDVGFQQLQKRDGSKPSIKEDWLGKFIYQKP